MKKLLLIAMVGALAGSAFAEDDEVSAERFWTPVQLNLASPIGIPWADRDVYGLRMNIFYGHSIELGGLDLGLVGVTRGSVRGLQMNVFNHVEGSFYGVQFGPFANYIVKKNYGLQLAGILNWGLDDGIGAQIAMFNVNGSYIGAQLGLWNSVGALTGFSLGVMNTSSDCTGCSIALVNQTGNLHGCQLGFINLATGHSEGLQFGVFNGANDLSGVQLGLLNLNCAGSVPALPFFNIHFR